MKWVYSDSVPSLVPNLVFSPLSAVLEDPIYQILVIWYFEKICSSPESLVPSSMFSIQKFFKGFDI